MIFKQSRLLPLLLLSLGAPISLRATDRPTDRQTVQHPDPTVVVRRIASTVQLAAQEYGLGVSNGKVVLAAEVEEARLFLTEAGRSAGMLPDSVRRVAQADIDRILAMVKGVAPAESVTAAAHAFVAGLGNRFQIVLDDIPPQIPALARGASVYQVQCARCHGQLGRGDGPDGAGLDPAPANLTLAAALRDASPLDFYRRVTVGVAGTGMPAYEQALSTDDRWAVALYASTLRLPVAEGKVPAALTPFPTTARLSDGQIMQSLGPDATLGQVAAVRAAQATAVADASRAAAVFDSVRRTVANAAGFAARGEHEAARQAAFDAYLVFEQVERDVRAKDPRLAGEAEAAFAALRESALTGGPAWESARRSLDAVLERAERVVSDRLSPFNLFLQSLIILLREGLEAILVIGALMAFLVKTGAGQRRRDIHIGVGAAVGASLFTAFVIETVFRLSTARQELLEGITMGAAAVMLFYVSYWLLTKVEVARWNAFVKGKVQDAVSSGSALALATVAFLAVYREGFETVLFYKALMVSGGTGGLVPILTGMGGGAVALAGVYVAVNRFGVRLPLKPFFAVTSAFLYYMAFVFAGQAVAELQESGLVGTTFVSGGPRLPPLGIYPTVESLAAQGALIGLAVLALIWLFGISPVFRKPAAAPAVVSQARTDREVVRSLE
ncbi:MAG TPA: FTR1 family protein, partial [Gemmatimonadales bacterium]